MKKRFLAIFIVVLLLFSQITVFANDLDSSTTSINPEDKLTDELKEVMSNTADDEYISISVWLYELDDSYVYSTISEHYGVEINQNNENAFLQTQINDKISKFHSIASRNEMTIQTSEISIQTSEQITNEFNAIRNNSIVNDTISDNDLIEFIKSGKDISEIVARSEQNAYTKEWRNARKNINSTINEAFENSLNLNKCKKVYVDSLIGYATLDCQNSYISTIASSPLVEKVDLFIKDQIELEDLIDEETIESTTTPLGYHMFQSKLPVNYNGAGVNIGVLESTKGNDSTYFVHYDKNNVHLANKEDKITIRIDPEMDTSKISTVPDDHVTSVLAILWGNPVQSTDGIYYSGVAPAANIYYTNVLGDITNFADGLTWLVVENNVAVINISTGDDKALKYCDYDQYIDCLVAQYRVSVVVAGGNDGSYIAHPAMAYNAITVGFVGNPNATTGLYTARSESSYNQYAETTNKPDIVSYGLNIYMLDNDYSVDSDPPDASSVATPIVTGTVALMLEANPSLENNPDKIKAILLTSANNEQIDTSVTNDAIRWGQVNYMNNYLSSVESVTRNRTGAGLINIKAAVTNATSSITLSYDFSSTSSITTNEYFIPADTEFKIGLVFEKIDHDMPTEPIGIYGSRINFDMININNGDIVLSSADLSADSYSMYDNVKIFDITTETSGTYVFKIYCSSFDSTNDKDTTSLSIHQNSHSTLNVTLAITCSCLNPYTYSYDIDYTSDSTATMHSCNNTGCFYTVINGIEYYSTLNENFSYGTVTYTMTYNYSYSYNKIITNDNLNISIDLSNSTQTYQVIGSGGDSYYTATGYGEYRQYEVFIINSDGSLYGIYEIDVHILYDNFILKINLY